MEQIDFGPSSGQNTKLHVFCGRALLWLCFGCVRMNMMIILIKHSCYSTEITSLDGGSPADRCYFTR